MVKVSCTIDGLYLSGFNKFGEDGFDMLVETLQQDGFITAGYVEGANLEKTFNRNKDMLSRARQSVICLLALGKVHGIIRFNWVPKDILTAVAKMMWQTRGDIEGWKELQQL